MKPIARFVLPTVLLASILNSRLLARAVLWAAIGYAILQLGIFVPRNLARTDRERDMVIYHQAARAALHRQPLYQMPRDSGPHRTLFVYIYAPPFAALLSPLGALSFVTFARVWSLFLLLAFWIYAWCLARLYEPAAPVTTRRWLIAGLASGLCHGSLRALALGQVDPILWALFGLGLVQMQTLRRNSSGGLWMAAALAKPFYAWPLLVAMVRGEALLRRQLFWAAGTLTVAALVLGYVVCGVTAYLSWLRDVLPVLGQGTFNADNFSLSMAVLRLARALGWAYQSGPLPFAAKAWLSLATVGGPLLMWCAVWSRRLVVQCACVGAAATLCAPLCWSSYLPVVLSPLALWLGTTRKAFSAENSGEIDAVVSA